MGRRVRQPKSLGEMSEYLPEDVVIDVLSRLPGKFLKRFHCVSKQWKALIENPNFIQIHLDRSPLRVVIGRARSAEDYLALPKIYFLYSAEELRSRDSFLRTRKGVGCPLEEYAYESEGTFSTVNCSPDGKYVAVTSHGNFYLTWKPGQPLAVTL